MNKIIIDSSGDYYLDNCEYDIEFINNLEGIVNFYVKDDIKSKIYLHGVNNSFDGEINYYLDSDSNLDINKFSFNSKGKVIENIYLNGKGSCVRYNFSSVIYGENYYKIKVFHNNSNVCSYINNNCIGNDNSEIVFDIDSILEKGNVSCEMDQTTKIMCLGDVKAKICPNMYIDEEDVKARHGSVIGRFSDDDIFYIMSRGIDYGDAIILLIKGFILSNLKIDSERIKEIVDILSKNYNRR